MEEKIKEIRNNTEKAVCYFSKKIAFSIGPVELKNLSEENEVKIVDVRQRSDYEVGHIPMAISIPFEEIKDRLNELNKEDLHVVYAYGPFCHKGAKAALILAEHNIPVIELCGGFKVWTEEFHFATTE